MKKTSSEWSTNKAPIFRSSYQGESEYILCDGRKVSVRTFADPAAAYNTGVYAREIEPLVGTVRFTHSPDFHTIPGPDVLQWFPGFIGARFTDDGTWATEYSEARPLLILDPVTEYVYSGLQLLADKESNPYSAQTLERGRAMRPGSLPRWHVSIWKSGERRPEHTADFFGRDAEKSAQRYAAGTYVTRKLSEGYHVTTGPVIVQA